jgi:histidyl-tRNA synthetase
MKFEAPKGTRDILPEEMKKYNAVMARLRAVYERFGFQPLDTPAFENFGLFASKGGLGDAVKDELYYFKDKSDRELALRFEFTASLARVISNNTNLPKPFKRYQIGKVWRYDNPQAMRWREFRQADVDIVGSDSPLADVECLAVAVECLKELGFKEFMIRINDRKLVDEMLLSFKITKVKDAFRIIDKLDKIGIDGVKKELKENDIETKNIEKMLSTKGNNSEILAELEKKYKEVKTLKEILSYAKYIGIDKYLKLDLSLVRGLEYYTGPVFEVSLGANVSCGGGGRYDNLIKTMGGPELPATGISFGVDRVVSVMTERKMFNDDLKNEIFLVSVNDSVRDEVMKLCSQLRTEGVAADFDLMGRPLSKQLQYANSLGISYVAVIGDKELKEKTVKIKNMKTGEEKSVKTKEISKSIGQ